MSGPLSSVRSLFRRSSTPAHEPATAERLQDKFNVSKNSSAYTTLTKALSNREIDRDVKLLLALDLENLTEEVNLDNPSTRGQTVAKAFGALVTKKEDDCISYDFLDFLHQTPILTKLSEQLCANLSDVPIRLSISRKFKSVAMTGKDIKLGVDEVMKDVVTHSSEDHVIAIANGYPIGDAGIADHMELREYATENNGRLMLLSGADGSGKFISARKAALDANTGFLTTVAEGLAGHLSMTLKQIGQLSVAGVMAAQQKVIADDGMGLTTHCSIVAKLESSGRGTAVATSVGDMSIFVRRSDGNIEEITRGNRGNTTSATDPGGQLGAFVRSIEGKGPGYARLSNLTIYQFEINPGDTIALMSDGLRDNLDPAYNGFETPEDVRTTLLGNKGKLSKTDLKRLEALKLPRSWEEHPDVKVLKEIYALYLAKEVAHKYSDKPFIEALTRHAFELTSKVRNYTAGAKFPETKGNKEYMGKMDHQTGMQFTAKASSFSANSDDDL